MTIEFKSNIDDVPSETPRVKRSLIYIQRKELIDQAKDLIQEKNGKNSARLGTSPLFNYLLASFVDGKLVFKD